MSDPSSGLFGGRGVPNQDQEIHRVDERLRAFEWKDFAGACAGRRQDFAQ